MSTLPVSAAPNPPQPTAPSEPFSRSDIAVVGLLTASVVAFFWKVLFTPAMLFYRDVFNYSYPHARFIQEMCREGALPYWNPYLNYGQPVLTNPNFLFFYPSTLLIVLLPINLAYALHYIAHFAIAAMGAYGLARRWGQSRTAALFAASVLAFSGPLLSLGNLYNHVACVAWIPWALLATDRATEGRSLRPWLLLALLFSLQFLAAEPLTLLATFSLSMAYALYRVRARRQLHSRSSLSLLGRFLLVGGLMLALCAVQLLPSLDLLRNSRRGIGLTYSQTAGWVFHPLSMLELVLPDFFGSPLTTPLVWTRVLNGGGDPYYLSVFVGFAPLFFGLAGWALGRDPRRNFAAGAAATFLVLSFGRCTPVFALAYLLIPPLALVRFPAKLLVPAVMMTAMLVGWGFDALRASDRPWAERRRRMLEPLLWVTVGVSLVWTLAWLAPSRMGSVAAWVLLRTNETFARGAGDVLSPRQVGESVEYFLTMLRLLLPGLAGYALGGLVLTMLLERGRLWARRAIPIVAILGLVHLVVVNYRANPTVSKTFYTYRPPVIEDIEDSPLPYRFCTLFREPFFSDRSKELQRFLNFDSIPEARGFSTLAQAAFRDRLLLARGSMLERVEAGFSGDVEGSLPTLVSGFWTYTLREIGDVSRADCLLGRTNVKYEILPARHTSSTTRQVAGIFNGSSEPSLLYENLCATPRAFVAGTAFRSQDTRETLSRLSDPYFDFQREVIIAAESNTVPAPEETGPAGRVEIVERHPNAVTLRAELSRPAYVVLIDRYDPNWHAAIDGREVPVLRANQMFRAVLCPAGKHEIRFAYRQKGLRSGAAISLAAFSLLIGLYFVSQDSRR